MKIYISGPMSCVPSLNKPAFFSAAIVLRDLGFQVVNPAENGLPEDAPWADHMRADIKMLVDCDAVACLPGWEKSRGAKIEVDLARVLGLSIRPYAIWLQG